MPTREPARSTTDPLGHETRFGYDDFGRRTTVEDTLHNVTSTQYDVRGRVTRVTQPDGTHTDFEYDSQGRRTAVTDPAGRTTRYAYDRYGWLEKVSDPAGGSTSYGYDAMGRLTSLTDALGRTTRFVYDNGRVTRTIYPGYGEPSEVYGYDIAGRLAAKTDRKGVTTAFEYDALGRLLRKTYSDGTPAVTYTYDEAGMIGRLTSAANGADTLHWTYDLAGQLLSETSTKNTSEVSYTYDAGGNRISLALNGQVHVTYTYDDASRLSQITRGASVFGFGYDAANRRTTLTYPNGVVTSYAYDTLSRLTGLSAVLNQTTPITSFAYAYDAAGNRTSKTLPEYSEAYAYDPAYRLTGVDRTGSTTGLWRYTYDGVGNRLTAQSGDAVTTSTYNEKNQLLSSSAGGTMLWRGQLNEPGTVAFTSALVNGQPARMLSGNTFEALLPAQAGTNTVSVQATDTSGNVATKTYAVDVPAGGATYTYDPNGNLTSKTEGTDNWGYEWNARDELTRVTKNGAEQARFSYDPFGRRVEKITGSIVRNYTYAGLDILAERQAGVVRKFVHGPGLDEPLAEEDDSGVLTFHHTDALGSIVKSTNQAGAVVRERRYDAWGNLEIGASEAGHAFTGREWDVEIGLYYHRARYLDPASARFLAEDPIRFAGGGNLYAYVLGNPVKWTDQLGLSPNSGTWGPWGPYLPPGVWKCFCKMWKDVAKGQSPYEAAASIYYNQTTGDFYCVRRPPDPRQATQTVTIDPQAAANVHTHPNSRTDKPSYPADYGACRKQSAFLLSKSGIYEMPTGCPNDKCLNRVAKENWWDDCPD